MRHALGVEVHAAHHEVGLHRKHTHSLNGVDFDCGRRRATAGPMAICGDARGSLILSQVERDNFFDERQGVRFGGREALVSAGGSQHVLVSRPVILERRTKTKGLWCSRSFDGVECVERLTWLHGASRVGPESDTVGSVLYPTVHCSMVY